jgi:hypothetical protein
LRLDLLYPGQLVAFRDQRDEAGKLVFREVVCASSSLPKVHRHLAALPEAQRHNLLLDRVENEPGGTARAVRGACGRTHLRAG